MARLSFWTQALDNQSDDLIEVDGSILATSTPEARSVLRKISSVARNGKEISSQQGIRIIADWPYYTIIIPCEQRDADERQSRIHCLGELDSDDELALFTIEEALRIEKEVCAFASKIERSISDDTLSLLTASFVRLKKKVLPWRAVAWVLIAVVATLAIWWFRELIRYWRASNV